MRDFISTISLLYSIPVSGIVTLKKEKVFAVRAGEERFVLKFLDFSAAEISFITAAMDCLSRRGFRRFNEIIPAADGKPTAEIGGRRAMMTRFLTGRVPSYKEEADAAAVGAFLAELHTAAAGFRCSPDSPRWKWGKMTETMRRGGEDIAAFTEEIRKRGARDDFDESFLAAADTFRAEINSAAAELDLFYPALSAEGEKRGGFCHHDPAHHNFLINEKGAAAFDFDYAIADLAGHDVAALLLKLLKANRWRTERAAAALAAYEEHRPLSDGERRFIRCLLRYPYDFHHAAFARYREHNTSRRIEKKMARLLREAPLREKALADFG
ncbi:MAG: CotS family spore coat protein [Bacillota bacterium]|jgi:CotS family spore coat protein